MIVAALEMRPTSMYPKPLTSVRNWGSQDRKTQLLQMRMYPAMIG
jgi:hypothetical protein